ncbi:type VI secretion system protein TssA [Herbaspirillum sp. SJZ107]|uniref:type VI secretion system protein TssA n=1 Tax=Herbaspirillum sp. SJZ107 TaxID=2572881 RepID=UPI00114EB7B2|nr:type VI secretion system protein TssA [Herbaspirillum sp. SJZ107]TQK08253.1 type VI secretion system protein ImpA [Herbaspirillum sp. SJZ107]
MSTIDIETLLEPVADEQPCGPNLEYDPAFVALEQEALGKPEVQYGDTITPAVPPDWKVVRRMAAELLERSRDLRLAAHLVRANLALHGIPGLADGVELIERLLDRRWDSVHPELDPDDDLDPTLRINSLAIMADGTTLIRELRDATLLRLPGLGPLSIKLIEIANGEIAPGEDQEKIAISSIEHAIADVDADELARSVQTIERALNAAVNVELTLVRQVGSSQALNLDALTRPLRKAFDFLRRQQDSADAGQSADGADTDTDAGTAATGEAAARGARPGISGEIANRDDVVRMLDKLVQYYNRYEPSSPIPILLERAKRLVPMNFFEIMQDMAPDGIAQLKVIRGPDGSETEDEY